MTVSEANFKEACFQAREKLKDSEKALWALRSEALAAKGLAAEVTGEMMANVMLAYRHLEDCRMRLGKAIQAFDGGTSVYPR